MSHAHEHGNVGVPRPALMAMGALVLFALLATTWVRTVPEPAMSPRIAHGFEKARASTHHRLCRDGPH
jgi:hypothetical protein